MAQSSAGDISIFCTKLTLSTFKALGDSISQYWHHTAGAYFWKVADAYMRICKRAMAQSITSAIDPVALNVNARPDLPVILYRPRIWAKLQPYTISSKTDATQSH